MYYKLSDADISFVGEMVQDAAGFSVVSAGYVNGDGLDDILISALTLGSEFNRAGLSTGIYFYKLQTGGIQQVKRMLLLK